MFRHDLIPRSTATRPLPATPVYSSVSSPALATFEGIRGKVNSKKQTFATASHLLQGSNIDFSWLLPASKTYNISSDPHDYVFVDVPIVTVDFPNRNMQAFPYEEVTHFDHLHGRMVYQTFVGKACHQDHCFPANTKVRVEGGLEKNIQDIQVGDMVLTDKNRYRKVTKVFNNGVKSLIRVVPTGLLDDLDTTDNHPLMVVDRRQVYGRYDSVAQSYRRNLRVKEFREVGIRPHFRPASDVYPGDYLCVPIEYGGDVQADKNFAFLLGAFLAEGHYNKNKEYSEGHGINLTCGAHEKDFISRIVAAGQALGTSPKVYENKTPGCTWVMISSVSLAKRIRACAGEYAEGKHIQGEARTWDHESTMTMLGAYMSGDGGWDRKKGSYRARSCSQDLLRDLQQAFAFVGIPACIGMDIFADRTNERNKVKAEAGEFTIVARNDSGYIRVSNYFSQHLIPFLVNKIPAHHEPTYDSGRLIIAGGFILTPIQRIEQGVGEEEVFNIEVEEDHTYVANGVVVHNCNDQPLKAKGVIFDASLEYISAYDVWKIRILTGWDRTKDKDLVNAILNKERTGYSMGALVNNFVCSVCNAICPPDDDKKAKRCRCMNKSLGGGKGGVWNSQMNRPVDRNDMMTGDPSILKLIYQLCCGSSFFENSSVDDPADHTADTDGSQAIWIA